MLRLSTRRDITYYYDRLRQRGEEIYAEMTQGKSRQEVIDLEEELEARTFLPAMAGRIAQYLGKARALVNALAEAGPEPKKIGFMVVYPPWEYGTFDHVTLNRTDIIAALEDIASDSFGDDVAAWAAWIDAWEEESPPTGYR